MVPRLLELIDSTTNWYIRLNRQRLKGDRGTDEAVIALNTLFDVLYTIVRSFAPFMPFLSDKLWLHLQEYMPRELLIGDVRSVHFLPFPEPRQELSDEVVERRFARMQKVIELGRVCREKEPAIGLKQALKTLTVLHPDQEYLDDVASLADYIKDELSIVSLVLSSDESRYGVQYRCAAHWATFGKKFRKDAKKVAEGLAGLSSTQVKQLMHGNVVEIARFEVSADDVVIKREIASNVEGSRGTEIRAHGDLLILLDKTIYPELKGLRLTREIASRVRKLRKKAALVPTDEVLIEYTVLSDPDDVGIEDALATQTGTMERMARLRMEKHKSTSERAEGTAGTKAGDVIIEEVQEVQGALFSLRLSMP